MKNIDWKLLKKQKETLCNVIHDNRHNETISGDLDGILNLLDAIQDEFEPAIPPESEQEKEIIDLFEQQKPLPTKVREVLEKYGEIQTYDQCEAMLKDMQKIGYTFEYCLDAVPFNLRKIEEEQEKYEPIEGQKFARKCDVTGEGMDEGFCIEDGQMYIKYKKDLIEHLRKLNWAGPFNWDGTGGINSKDIKDDKELMEFFHNEDYYYWTSWIEEVDEDFEYIFTNGQIVEIELIESLVEQEEQETKQTNDTTWDFIEKYYPNYSSSDQICRALDLLLKKETEDLSSEEDIEITYILEDVYEQAIANFIKINGGI